MSAQAESVADQRAEPCEGSAGNLGPLESDLGREALAEASEETQALPVATAGSNGFPGQTCRVVVSAPFLTYINESAV